jgi:hypothetical protein
MVVIALAMFLGLFAFGGEVLGYTDPQGHVQFGIFVAFVLGIVCGYRVRS